MIEISKTEYQIMDVIWQLAPCTAQDVITKLNEQGDWHEKTVKTLIGRLVKKEALAFEQDGRTYVYSPIIDKHEYKLTESKNLLERMFNGKLSPMVAAFAKQNKLTQQDVDELKSIIDRWENTND
jgi:predicted transcriptional regulator